MAEMSLVKRRRFVNPGHRRKMTAKQIRFFGTKRQRAALKNVRRRKRNGTLQITHHANRARNISHIVVVRPRNPGRMYPGLTAKQSAAEARKARALKKKYGRSILRKGFRWLKGSATSNRGRRRNRTKVIFVNKGRNMARRRNRRALRNRRRRNVHYVRKQRRGLYLYKNPRRYRRHRRNPGVRRYRHHYRHHRLHNRRRNPGFFGETLGRVGGVLGGLAITKFLFGFVPSSFNTGFMGYLAAGIIGVAQGKLIGKAAKNEQLGNDLMVGGLAYAFALVLNSLFPSIGSYVGISGGRGMGLIGGSSFYVPQVNVPGSMGTFQVPGAVSGAIMGALPAANTGNVGMGRLRRTGRLM
jgi:hypothetical protein